MQPLVIRVVLVAVCLSFAARAERPPAPLRWSRLPIDVFLCTRFGPDWSVGKGPYPSSVRGRTTDSPFALTVPPGLIVKFTVKTTGGVEKPAFRASGLPPGATLDPTSGAFVWTAAGKPGDSWSVELAAAAETETVTWPMTVTIASEALQLAWRAGVGGKTWMDCTARPGEVNLTEVDLDNDGLLDVLVETSWTDPGDGHEHVFSSHELVLRRPRPGKPDSGRRIDWLGTGADGAFMGSVSIERGPEGTLLLVKQHACDGPSPVELVRVQKNAALSAGRFESEERVSEAGTSEVDYDFKVDVERDPSGAITAVTTSPWGKTKRHTWRRGAFR